MYFVRSAGIVASTFSNSTRVLLSSVEQLIILGCWKTIASNHSDEKDDPSTPERKLDHQQISSNLAQIFCMLFPCPIEKR